MSTWLRNIVIVAVLAAVPIKLSAQVAKGVQVSTPYSHGEWVPYYIDFTNTSGDTIDVSAYLGNVHLEQKYKDTLGVVIDTLYDGATAHFVLLPSAGPFFRLPMYFRSPDSVAYHTHSVNLSATFYDRATTRYDQQVIHGVGYSACPHPVEFTSLEVAGNSFKSLTNKDKPSVLRQGSAGDVSIWNLVSEHNQSREIQTDVALSVVGEFVDSFKLTDNYHIPPTMDGYLPIVFRGAPRSLIHDTIIAVYSNCWGSVSRRYPIEAYSVYDSTYYFTSDNAPFVAPFLGHAEKKFLVHNLSSIALRFSNLHFTGADPNSFQIVDAPDIPPHDSGAITIRLDDNSKLKDAVYTNARSVELQGNVIAANSEIGIRDSSFSISVTGKIDVYCPDYFSLVPLMRTGVHPAGIIFNLNGTGERLFPIVFGNDDSVSEEFYPPYFDDPRFSIAISGRNLPATIQPFTDFITSKISYAGPARRTVLTRLHWSRLVSGVMQEIAIDVMAYDPSDLSFEGVSRRPATRLVVWPSPASTILHVSDPDLQRGELTIINGLGSVVRRTQLIVGGCDITVEELPAGMYQLMLSGNDVQRYTVKFEIVK